MWVSVCPIQLIVVGFSFYSARNARITSAVLATAIPSVCPSHARIVSKRRHVARCSLHCCIAKCVQFCRNQKNIPQGRPFPLKLWLKVTYPLLKAASFDMFCLVAPQLPQNGDQNAQSCRILDDFDNEGRKVCCKVSLYKNCQPQSCSAFDCLSSGINILAGGRPLPPEILPPSDLPSPVNGILWEMSELITQERIAIGSSNLVEGLTT